MKRLLFLVNKHPKLLKQYFGLCDFISELYDREYISEDDKLNIKSIILSSEINPKYYSPNRLGVRFSFIEKTSYSMYWFKPGCVWRRKLWLKRLILKLEKDV